MKPDSPTYQNFLANIKNRIRNAQYQALKKVNQELISLYWDIGRSIKEKQEAEGWGKSIVEKLSTDLQKEFPGIRGFSQANLWRMRSFYITYHQSENLAPMVREIGWSHNVLIVEKCTDMLEREFYIRMTRKYGWTKNVLKHQIEGNAYAHAMTNPQTRGCNPLLIEGKAYAHAMTGQNSFDTQLPEYAGKMQFYLSVLNDTHKLEHENPAIGIIVCKTKNRTVVEYALKESKQPMGVASYSMHSQLPKHWEKLLPTPEQISKNLKWIENEFNE